MSWWIAWKCFGCFHKWEGKSGETKYCPECGSEDFGEEES